jgi:ABC-type multidrug transport system fused ATPase/permease subunit
LKSGFKTIRTFQIFPIDFTKPWWHLILKQKFTCFLILTITASMQIFTTIVPFLIALIFESEKYAVCIGIFALWFALVLLQVFIMRWNPKFQLQCIYSIYQNAHSHLLSVDPEYHVHRSSGAILNKIDRAARGYEDLLDYIVDEYTPLIVGLLTVIIIIASYSYIVAGAIIVFMAAMIAGAYFFAKYASLPWEKGFIKSDDAFKTTAVENLAQVQLIRSTFATDYRSAKLNKNIAENLKTEGALWLSYSSVSSGLILLYLVSLFALAMALLFQVKHQLIPYARAIGLFLSYMQGTKSIVTSVKLFRKTMRSLASIRELFRFIPSFGKRQIPVLEAGRELLERSEIIEIKAQNIDFDYGNALLFNNHSFALRASKSKSNKLYGIIGPSGSGKTTLLSILGGQLKPISGTVLVDSIDIYQIGDATRRQLIALQGQISTNMQGTVKSNLLLGLPDNAHYTDGDLTKLIDDVGLLAILDAHEGLETKIGEGGLNLSGGQRQRLNFAALFLRASYYNPDLILIDEPTSSLDEISEAKITAMLSKLATSAVTLVIAHRLKTVAEAAGLIDLSLLSKTEEVRAYSPQELKTKSEYYRQLMEGNVALDS